MSINYSKVTSKSNTPQSEPLRGEAQVKNDAGGFVYQLDKWSQLDRFLILGTECGTYYASERKLTIDNANNIFECIKEDGKRVVDIVVDISDKGRAPKNDPALFVLALCASVGDTPTRQYALSNLGRVARIGTHLFHFAEYANANRGWGRALKRAIGNWYNTRTVESLVSQVTKYQQRDGWSNRDLLRLSHPKTEELDRKAVYDWICGRANDNLPVYLRALDELRSNPSSKLAIDCISKFKFPRELIPTELLNDPEVWRVLLYSMPMTALIRNLNKMTALGLFKPMSRELNFVIDQFTDPKLIKNSRLHPLTILSAMKQYSVGHGDRGSLSWKPVQQIIDVLNDAFYLAFGNVTPTGKKTLIALDVSGSMTWGNIAGTSINPREASAAMCLITANIEKNYHIMGFSNKLVDIKISPKMRLNDVIKEIEKVSMGGTDCAQPMIFADTNNIEVDTFIVYTDNETWAGRIHPSQALKDYRKKFKNNAKLVVVGMTATNFTIADPKDAGMMDVVGFDSAAPEIISQFSLS